MGELRILSEQTVKRCLEDEIDACFEVCAKAYRYYVMGSVLSEPSSLYLQLPFDGLKNRLKGRILLIPESQASFARGAYYVGGRLADRSTGRVGCRELAHRRRTAVTGI